jgi:hypothetical protein
MTNAFQLDGQIIAATSTGEFQLCSDDTVLFSGTDDQLTFMRGGEDTIIAMPPPTSSSAARPRRSGLAARRLARNRTS